jgi:hypothetical protein
MKILFIISFLLLPLLVWAQSEPDTSRKGQVQVLVKSGDTTLFMALHPIEINANPTPVFKNDADQKQYWKLVRNIKRVHPYAKMARAKLDSMSLVYQTLKTDKERQAYVKATEKKLEKEITPILLDLSYAQGDLLIKLIDRETGKCPYDMVKEFRGAFRAVFYQTIARIFTHNLKDRYDKDGKDRTIEMIIQGIERGYY